MLTSGPVRHLLPNLHYLSRMPYPVAIAAGLVALTVGALVVWRFGWRRRPDEDALERARRARLARIGRLTDGNLVDVTLERRPGADPVPARMLLYRYRVAGVRYEAMQDVSGIENLVRDLRIDLPIQVRYDVENPGDSIVVSEDWCGLRFGSQA